MIIRRKTRQINVGGVRIGGNAPISIQSMAKTDTKDIAKTVGQIKRLERAGCEIVRVAVKDLETARAIKEIKKKINIPLVADIHFNYKLAMEAIEAGADKIRLNPGNIKKREEIEVVIRLAKAKKVPIRIGVNSGSVKVTRSVRSEAEPPRRGQGQCGAKRSLPEGDKVTSKEMAGAALRYIKLFESMGFYDIIVSLKGSDVATTIDAYRQMAKACDYPFHLGITAAGPSECGIIKSSVGIGALLSEGIGDTIRVSLTGEPEDEVRAAQEILRSLGLRKSGIDIISCPTCGRCEVNLVKIVKDFEKKIYPSGLTSLSKRDPRGDCHPLSKEIKVAIMGCVVNGPGEAREADIGIAAGKHSGMLFRRGKPVRKIKEEDFVRVLLSELKNLNTIKP